jgi:predicted transcriptional regulator
LGINEISRDTGVAAPTIAGKVGYLFAEGYITEEYCLTEKGFEALRIATPNKLLRESM